MVVRRTLSLVVLAACGGSSGDGTNIKPTLHFAELSDVQIGRILSSAAGSDMFAAQNQVDRFADSQPDPCPQATINGDEVFVTGGCTTMGGVAVAGDVAIKNAINWSGASYNFAAATSYEFRSYALDTQGKAERYDGRVTVRDHLATYDADLTADLSGVIVRSDIVYRCSSSSTCEIVNSGVELIGTGGALVDGMALISGTNSHASYTLTGTDQLTAMISSGCVQWQIDGGAVHTTGNCP